MNIKDLNKIEFWGASFIYGTAVLMLISTGSSGNTGIPMEFNEAHIEFDYLSNYFIPELFRYSIIFFCFLLLNFCCLPALYKKVNVGFNSFVLCAAYLISGLVISIAQTYSKAYLLLEFKDIDNAYNRIFFQGFNYAAWLILLIAIYVALKKLLIYFISTRDDSSHHQMKLEIVFGLAFWFMGVLLWVITGPDFEVILCWTLVVFACIFLAIYSLYYLIPEALKQHKPLRSYYLKMLGLTLIVALPLSIGAGIASHADLGGVVLAFHLFTQLLITAPLSWYIYKRRNDTAKEIFTLKKELGKSDASLGFLKSQINPHFLFNALNTLYGTALQESAERSAEGIQKLGDMMRFMLQENMQDKISLTRDIEYLNNYISLQKLRTSTSVDIDIKTDIEDHLHTLQISPMLLIPFVENAFKHGISLQSPSHIRITLQTKGSVLYFDVNNSIHLKADGDPEKLQGGIGLPNVKQRLELLYPGNHDLSIRESATDYFVHLTLNLS